MATDLSYRRDLPHLRTDDAYYSLTWRLHPKQSYLLAAERTIVAEAIEFFHPDRYRLAAYVVMDHHVHVVAHFATAATVSKTVHTWKSFTANRLQREHRRTGVVWQQEYYDHIVSLDEELESAIAYIIANPERRWPGTTDYPWARLFRETAPSSTQEDSVPPPL